MGKAYARAAVVRTKARWKIRRVDDGKSIVFPMPCQMRTVVGWGKTERVYWGKVPPKHRPVSVGVMAVPEAFK